MPGRDGLLLALATVHCTIQSRRHTYFSIQGFLLFYEKSAGYSGMSGWAWQALGFCEPPPALLPSPILFLLP